MESISHLSGNGLKLGLEDMLYEGLWDKDRLQKVSENADKACETCD